MWVNGQLGGTLPIGSIVDWYRRSRCWDMKVVPSQEGGGRRSYRGSGMMKNGRSKGPVGISYGSECSRDVSMALGMREIVGQKALTCYESEVYVGVVLLIRLFSQKSNARFMHRD